MSRPPHHALEQQNYVCAATGQLIESVLIYEWDRERGRYVKVREYPLANEARVNPGFRS